MSAPFEKHPPTPDRSDISLLSFYARYAYEAVSQFLFPLVALPVSPVKRPVNFVASNGIGDFPSPPEPKLD